MANEIDKEQLYGRYQKYEDRRNGLALKMAHKALDIPDDDMQINAPKTTNNYYSSPASSAPGWMKAALAGTTLVAAALGGSYLNALLSRTKDPPTPINTRVESHEGFLLELVPGNGNGKVKP